MIGLAYFALRQAEDAFVIPTVIGRFVHLHPLWNGSLRRTVRFVGADGTIPHAARWLVVAPGRELDPTSSEAGRWRRVLRTASGWSVFSRFGGS